MQSVTLRFPAAEVRRLPDPNQPNASEVYFHTRVDQLPVAALSQWKDVNPREVDTKTKVYKDIVETLRVAPDSFRRRNRGLTITAEVTHYDEKKKEIRIVLSDRKIHGLVDGGHTLCAAGEGQAGQFEALSDAYVNVRIVLGVQTLDDIVDVAGGLNTSQQVNLAALANLERHFDDLKEVLKPMPCYEQVAWKMNEPKPIDVREILYYLAVFDCSKYPHDSNKHPTAIFGRKEGLVKEFTAEMSGLGEHTYSFKSLIPMANQILILRDKLEAEVLQVIGGKTNAAKKVRNGFLYFLNQGAPTNSRNESLELSTGWLMPMLGGFRANVKWDQPKGRFSWKMDINELLARALPKLIEHVKDVHIRENSKPEYVGRSSTAWRGCYETVNNVILQYENEVLRERLRAS